MLFWMLNEENSHLIFIGIDFELDEITKARDDELSNIRVQLLTPKLGKFAKYVG